MKDYKIKPNNHLSIERNEKEYRLAKHLCKQKIIKMMLLNFIVSHFTQLQLTLKKKLEKFLFTFKSNFHTYVIWFSKIFYIFPRVSLIIHTLNFIIINLSPSFLAIA